MAAASSAREALLPPPLSIPISDGPPPAASPNIQYDAPVPAAEARTGAAVARGAEPPQPLPSPARSLAGRTEPLSGVKACGRVTGGALCCLIILAGLVALLWYLFSPTGSDHCDPCNYGPETYPADCGPNPGCHQPGPCDDSGGCCWEDSCPPCVNSGACN